MSTLLQRLTVLRDDAVAFVNDHPGIASLSGDQQQSAVNLLHYLSIRQHDLREMQQELIELGLTSLGILEAHTLATLNRVISWLRLMDGLPPETNAPPALGVPESSALLERRAEAIFGPAPESRVGRIMVTMPSEAATDAALVEKLLRSGMNVMRINCAHDDVQAWKAMIQHLRQAERSTGLHCKVQIDLGGPKLRTGSIEASGHVKKIKPIRNALGEVIQPAHVWLVPPNHRFVQSGETTLQASGDIACLRKGDTLHMSDARRSKRKFKVVAVRGDARLLESEKTTYAHEGAVLDLERKGKALGQATLVNIQEAVEPIALKSGDRLMLCKDPLEGTHPEHDEDGNLLTPGQIHCTLPEAFEYVEENHPVWFDDGKMGGIVAANDGECIQVHITHTPPGGGKLRSGKGINFPETLLHSQSLTAKDRQDLASLKDDIDMVAMSFVQSAEDVAELQQYMQELGIPDAGLIIKIENQPAFDNLPAILLQALQSPRIGVMIARGDLAVEVGFRRLSEIQEEIIWLCESAHVPVIWATQILEGLVKRGAPSRAEVTDAAASIRAECTMLNKGPNIVESVAFLDSLLSDMEAHYHKRRLMMRPLRVCMDSGV